MKPKLCALMPLQANLRICPQYCRNRDGKLKQRLAQLEKLEELDDLANELSDLPVKLVAMNPNDYDALERQSKVSRWE